MKKIFLGLAAGMIALGSVRAQDTAIQQQLDQMAGQLQDIIATQAAQDKRLATLEHDVAELHDKVTAPVVNNYANNDDLKKLAADLQEMDRKHQADRELILQKIEELAKLSATPLPPPPHRTAPPPKATSDETPPEPADVGPHYEYVVKAGDSLSAIIKAYNEKGVKVTLRQVYRANPGLEHGKLLVNKKIIIPMSDKGSK